MAVKVCVNGQMKKIDTTLHKPVIFLNGQKKVLDKAWIFVNGEKKMLWGQPGVQVDLISSDTVVSGLNTIKAVGEDWLVTTGNGNVNRLNISNLSNPSLIQSVAWGSSGSSNNCFLSNGSKLVFYGSASGSFNRLACDFSTGGVSVEKTYTVSNNTPFGDIGNSSIGYKNKTVSFIRPGPSSGASGMVTRTWGSDIYINDSVAYSFGYKPSGLNDSNWGPSISGIYLQFTSTEWYVNCAGVGSYASQNGLNKLSTSARTKVNGTLSGPIFLDGNNIVCLSSPSVNLVDKTSLAITYSSASLIGSGITGKVIGRNGDYYYVITYPATATQGGVATLYLLDKDDLSTVYTQILPTDPFGEFSGTSGFWNSCAGSPQVSGSGFLGVSGSISGQLRVVRFSQLL